ncbi:DUF3606 domain-containing protein [Luteibacter aegosomaticola]|uniref:DUF3606 domain-containing protein n=1 Tax=Luteibacter aegosomaticola TaxID=2911538 RepID=UPI001FF91DC2|nr:DUF3606 domain-containing protein [Luteibacter aegosomaticola]UPG88246.1 DUF3606 domain-containing protein [Luteibacter aegosomaticola]
MSDHFNRVTHINPDDPHDVALWALVLDVTPASVYAAVAEVGTDAEAVQAHLMGKSSSAGSGG